MLHFLSKSIVKNNIAKPLINGGTRRYYSYTMMAQVVQKQGMIKNYIYHQNCT